MQYPRISLSVYLAGISRHRNSRKLLAGLYNKSSERSREIITYLYTKKKGFLQISSQIYQISFLFRFIRFRDPSGNPESLLRMISAEGEGRALIWPAH